MRTKIVKNKRRLKKPVTKRIDTSDPVKAYDQVKLFFDKTRFLRNNAQGIASNQVGLDYRIFTALIGGKWQVFINPKYVQKSVTWSVFKEGCLSIKKKSVKIPRSNWIELKYSVLKSSIEGIKIESLRKRFNGSDARVIQHEMDHLYGRLITDYQQP